MFKIKKRKKYKFKFFKNYKDQEDLNMKLAIKESKTINYANPYKNEDYLLELAIKESIKDQEKKKSNNKNENVHYESII